MRKKSTHRRPLSMYSYKVETNGVFFKKLRGIFVENLKIFIGCDPGLTGAIAVIEIDEDKILEGTTSPVASIAVKDMPTCERSKTSVVKRKVDPRQCIEVLSSMTEDLSRIPTRIGLEQVATRPGQGSVSQGSLMHSLGIVEAVMGIAFPTEVDMVIPTQWKRPLHLIGKDKSASVMLCRCLFPDIFKSKSGGVWLKKHNGRADAILIALHQASKQYPQLLNHPHLVKGFKEFDKMNTPPPSNESEQNDNNTCEV